jgi:hypothetical protein
VNRLVLETPWPKCLYDPKLLCGEPATGALLAYGQTEESKEKVRRQWHVADMCDCPSCPLRCLIRDEVARRRSVSGEETHGS